MTRRTNTPTNPSDSPKRLRMEGREGIFILRMREEKMKRGAE
jgi:hypothetical protein